MTKSLKTILRVMPWRKIASFISVILEIIILTLIVVSIVFFIMDLIPGSHSVTSGIQDDDLKKIIEHKYGYDKDVFTRWALYIKNLFRGDFGISSSILPNQEIGSFIWKRVGTSMTIGLIAIAFSYAIGFPIGLYIGQRQGKAIDTISSAIIAVIISIPSIVFGLVMLIIGRKLGIPYIYDKDNVLTFTLPLITLVLGGVAMLVKLVRLQTVAEMNMQYSKFAAVKGVSKRRFVWVHAIKPASFLVISGLPGAVLGTMFGSMFIETIFQIPGMGSTLITAIPAKDINVIMFIVVLMSSITVISFRLRDVLYRMLDPRMRGR